MSTTDRLRRGLTTVELIIYVAVLSIAVAAFSKYMMGFVKTAKTSERGMIGSADLRLALMRTEHDLYEANQLIGVSASSVTFICDMLRNPSWDPDADLEGDGITNIRDTDVDGDAQLKFSFPLAQQWQVGYNLEDDDDDNDGNIDVRVQVYVLSKTVYRGISVNGGSYQVSKLAADVSSFTFTFYGSKREDLGRNIDLGADGAAGTGDAGEGDGVISEREIDWVQPPTGHGNRSGAIDTAAERAYIASVALYMESDRNRDGTPEAALGTEIMPPLRQLKRRR
jgi:hypothetical protein